jgi:hypothetical protein
MGSPCVELSLATAVLTPHNIIGRVHDVIEVIVAGQK